MIKVINLAFIALLFASVAAEAAPLCLAHRAEHNKNAENSLEGIREAIAAGADGVELDLRHTRDGVAIGVHDYILWRVAKNKSNRICPRFKPIPSLTLSQIRENCEFSSSQEIPTLEEILRLTQISKMFVLLQLKDDPSMATMELVKNYPGLDNLRIHSHWDSTLDRFEEFSKQKGFEVKTMKISKYWPRISDTRGNNLWWPFRWLLDLKDEIRQRETGLFLVNSSDALSASLRLKVDYIITDYPNLCGATKLAP